MERADSDTEKFMDAMTPAGMLLILLFVCVAYLPAISGGYVWDDDAVTENPQVRTPGGIVEIWTRPSENLKEKHYWPVVYSSFWLENRILGLSPVNHHLINVLLHVLNSILIGHLLARMRVRGAWFAAAVFALHPVHVESVAWVIERKDGLSALFYLLAFWTYRIFDERHDGIHFAASLLFFAAAMLTKSIVISLPIALALAAWRERGVLYAKDVKRLLAFVVLGAAIAAFDVWYVRTHEDPADFSLSALDRIVIACRAICFYLGKAVWPATLVTIYPRWGVGSGAISQSVFIPFVACIAGGTAFFARRGGRGLFAAFIFFIVTLAPILGMIGFGFMRLSFVADRFQYLASLGIILIACGGFEAALRRFADSFGMMIPAARGAVLLLLGVLTWRQAANYKGPLALWTYTANANPSSWTARSNLGFALLENNRVDDAILSFRQALAIKGDYENGRLGLAHALVRKGRIDEAVAEYREVIEFMPQSKAAHNDLGLALEMQGKLEEAEKNYHDALTIDPRNVEARVNLGSLLGEHGKVEEAMRYFNEALAIAPYHSDLHAGLALLMEGQNRPDEAMEHYRAALESDPRNVKARGNLAALLARMGKMEEAIDQLTTALRVRPDYYEGRMNLGLLLKSRGQLAEAVEQFSLALESHPEAAEAHNQLGIILLQQGRFGDAAAEFSEAVKLAPSESSYRDNLNQAARMKR